MFIDKEKEKAILSKFFMALCAAQVEMSKAINHEIDTLDPELASVNQETADVANQFSEFIDRFDDILRYELNVNTLAFFDDEETKQ